jgi:hypothetical protein
MLAVTEWYHWRGVNVSPAQHEAFVREALQRVNASRYRIELAIQKLYTTFQHLCNLGHDSLQRVVFWLRERRHHGCQFLVECNVLGCGEQGVLPQSMIRIRAPQRHRVLKENDAHMPKHLDKRTTCNFAFRASR